MPHVGRLRDYRFADEGEDLRGANVYGADGEKIGDIDDVIFDHASGDIRYLVVDTGGWLSSKRFILPPDRIRIGQGDEFVVDMRKEQIERLPAYDEGAVEDDARWRDYEDRYEKAWTTSGDVMHREGSDRVVTPTAEEMPGSSDIRSSDLSPTRLHPPAAPSPTASAKPDAGRPVVEPALSSYRAGEPGAGMSTSRPEAPAASAGDEQDPMRVHESAAGRRYIPPTDRIEGGIRWKAFNERLRRHRDQITAPCLNCERERRAA